MKDQEIISILNTKDAFFNKMSGIIKQMETLVLGDKSQSTLVTSDILCLTEMIEFAKYYSTLGTIIPALGKAYIDALNERITVMMTMREASINLLDFLNCPLDFSNSPLVPIGSSSKYLDFSRKEGKILDFNVNDIFKHICTAPLGDMSRLKNPSSPDSPIDTEYFINEKYIYDRIEGFLINLSALLKNTSKDNLVFFIISARIGYMYLLTHCYMESPKGKIIDPRIKDSVSIRVGGLYANFSLEVLDTCVKYNLITKSHPKFHSLSNEPSLRTILLALNPSPSNNPPAYGDVSVIRSIPVAIPGYSQINPEYVPTAPQASPPQDRLQPSPTVPSSNPSLVFHPSYISFNSGHSQQYPLDIRPSGVQAAPQLAPSPHPTGPVKEDSNLGLAVDICYQIADARIFVNSVELVVNSVSEKYNTTSYFDDIINFTNGTNRKITDISNIILKFTKPPALDAKLKLRVSTLNSLLMFLRYCDDPVKNKSIMDESRQYLSAQFLAIQDISKSEIESFSRYNTTSPSLIPVIDKKIKEKTIANATYISIDSSHYKLISINTKCFFQDDFTGKEYTGKIIGSTIQDKCATFDVEVDDPRDVLHSEIEEIALIPSTRKGSNLKVGDTFFLKKAGTELHEEFIVKNVNDPQRRLLFGNVTVYSASRIYRGVDPNNILVDKDSYLRIKSSFKEHQPKTVGEMHEIYSRKFNVGANYRSKSPNHESFYGPT